MEIVVWVLFAVAAVVTAYVLVNEPEEGPPIPADPAAANARYVAFAAAAIGAFVGVQQILREGGRRNLFAMAVLFDIIMASFWVLRFTLA
jgi:hypothetical protein